MNMKIIYLSFLLLICFPSCTTKTCVAPSLAIQHYLNDYFLDELEMHSENILSIGISRRGYRHIRVLERVDSSNLSAKRFVNFDPFDKNTLEMESGYLNDASLDYWHGKFLWMYMNGLLSMSKRDWGYMISTVYSDSTFQELAITNPEFKDVYFDHLKKGLRQFCDNDNINYRYRLLLPFEMQEKNDSSHFEVLLSDLSEKVTINRMGDFFYYRSLSRSEFCSISFSDPLCAQ